MFLRCNRDNGVTIGSGVNGNEDNNNEKVEFCRYRLLFRNLSSGSSNRHRRWYRHIVVYNLIVVDNVKQRRKKANYR